MTTNNVFKVDILKEYTPSGMEPSLYTDHFCLVYNLFDHLGPKKGEFNPKKEFIDVFYYIKDGLFIPRNSLSILQILSKILYQKDDLTKKIGREVPFLCDQKEINFDNLNDLNFGYHTKESYNNQEVVKNLGKKKNFYNDLFGIAFFNNEEINRIDFQREVDRLKKQHSGRCLNILSIS